MYPPPPTPQAPSTLSDASTDRRRRSLDHKERKGKEKKKGHGGCVAGWCEEGRGRHIKNGVIKMKSPGGEVWGLGGPLNDADSGRITGGGVVGGGGGARS